MRNLVLGAGEVGKSLHEVLSKHHETFLMDKDAMPLEGIEILNICYPYSKTFVTDTRAYIDRYQPIAVIVHSTVPVGTTRQIPRAVHSPIHGVHPYLADGIRTFPKLLGTCSQAQVGPNKEGRFHLYTDTLAFTFLKEAGLNVVHAGSVETSEMSKLLCTSYYAWNVIFCKEVAKLCEQYGVDFDVAYTMWNQSYNEGYEKLGKGNVRRPVLQPQPGPIGGHCLVPNAKLLDSWITNTIVERNKTYGDE